MKNVLFFSLWVVVAIGLISCEGGTTFTKTITNNSSETLTVELFTSTFSTPTTTTIAPNETKDIFWNDQLGGFVDDTYNCITDIDSVNVTVTNNKVLQKDLDSSATWTLDSKKDSRNSFEKCTCTITDDDLN